MPDIVLLRALNLRMAGLPTDYDQVVLRGRVEDGKFGLYYVRSGVLVSVDTVYRPAEHLLARKLLSASSRMTPDLAADESADLKAL